MKYDFDQVIDRTDSNSYKWQLGGRDLIPMWIADMDFQAPQPVIDAIVKRARHGVFGYAGPADTFFDAVIEWHRKRHGWKIQKEWIEFCPGIIPALHLLVRALTHPGDRIIVQTPVYYPFYWAVEKNGRHIARNQLVLENGKYKINFNDLEEKARDSRTKLLILCSPHNPVGRVWTREELSRLGDICMENNVFVISDELHCDLVFDGYTHVPFADISDEFAWNSVTCTAPSKTFNLAGLQTSSLIIPDPEIRELYQHRYFNIRPNPFGLVATEAAYTRGGEWLEQLMAYLADNLAFLKSFVKERLPMVDVIEPEGTYLVWMDFRRLGMDPGELEDLMLNQAGLWLDEGYIFGSEGAGFERFNIACPRTVLEEGLNRVADAVDQISQRVSHGISQG